MTLEMSVTRNDMTWIVASTGPLWPSRHFEVRLYLTL
jgi:hypothetical protein